MPTGAGGAGDSGQNNALGPVGGFPWPDKITAKVVTADSAARIHGYDVEEDLARHYRFSDGIYLSLTGELPDDAKGRAFELALHFLAPASISEAPTHAASLVRLCYGTVSAVIGAGAIGLAEQARFAMDEHAAWLAWLDGGGAMPAGFTTTDEGERASVQRLVERLSAAGVRISELDLPLGRTTAIVTLLHRIGFTARAQLEPVFVVARMACMSAEALAVKPTSFREYPLDLPAFAYEAKK